ncbi:mechanosensitive ion channel family protein, partial [Desulfosarcina sp.]|uniref:mechanosensitive ion channel family protein n=1 Tax=Desulfosarcina sp. TaxID=2027861 RepID=UPI0029A298D1
MEPQMTRMQRFGELMVDRGPETIISIVILIVGLLLIKWAMRGLRNALGKLIRNTTIVSIISNTVGILLFA